MGKPKSPTEITLRQLWQALLPRVGLEDSPGLPMWPPDTFALCAVALRQGSTYLHALDNWPPGRDEGTPAGWTTRSRKRAEDWLHALSMNSGPPQSVQDLWQQIAGALDEPMSSLFGSGNLVCQALLELLAVADEACSPGVFSFEIDAHRTLLENQYSSLCREIHPSRLRVLPKIRVPQRGLTLRSLSLFAGLAESSDIDARFYQNLQVRGELTLNLLILPWPFEIWPAQFKPSRAKKAEMGNMPSGFGFFTFEGRPAEAELLPFVSKVIRQAEKECGKISMLVLPEAAVSAGDAKKLQAEIAKQISQDCGLICGIGRAAKPGVDHGVNAVRLYAPGLEPVEQGKHHRWQLDRSQIVQYSLGNSLHHETLWWEHIDVTKRELAFVRLMPWLTVCVLICEDLARPDPAGDVIRAIGPNLVVSLLMDGPQLVNRWPNRHATILADDPGSSVLTLTSLGMSELSRPASGPSRGRVIGLWKEEGGASVEIELPKDKQAAVLSISIKAGLDWSADGRNKQAAVPSLTGVRFLAWEQEPRRGTRVK